MSSCLHHALIIFSLAPAFVIGHILIEWIHSISKSAHDFLGKVIPADIWVPVAATAVAAYLMISVLPQHVEIVACGSTKSEVVACLK